MSLYSSFFCRFVMTSLYPSFFCRHFLITSLYSSFLCTIEFFYCWFFIDNTTLHFQSLWWSSFDHYCGMSCRLLPLTPLLAFLDRLVQFYHPFHIFFFLTSIGQLFFRIAICCLVGFRFFFINLCPVCHLAFNWCVCCSFCRPLCFVVVFPSVFFPSESVFRNNLGLHRASRPIYSRWRSHGLSALRI